MAPVDPFEESLRKCAMTLNMAYLALGEAMTWVDPERPATRRFTFEQQRALAAIFSKLEQAAEHMKSARIEIGPPYEDDEQFEILEEQ